MHGRDAGIVAVSSESGLAVRWQWAADAENAGIAVDLSKQRVGQPEVHLEMFVVERAFDNCGVPQSK